MYGGPGLVRVNVMYCNVWVGLIIISNTKSKRVIYITKI